VVSRGGGVPRLLVIDPSVVAPEEEGAARIAAGWPGSVRVLRPALRPGDGPGPGDGYEADGVVVMGSAASVHDDRVWLHDLAAWLRPLLDGSRPLPLLAICFGHQLVAHLAGAPVGHLRPDHGKELGIRDTLVDGCRVLEQRRRLRVVASHCEVVLAPPPGFRVVARREGVPVDGLEHESLPVVSFQFHPEARRQFLLRRGLDPDLADGRVEADGDRVLHGFRQLVLRHVAAGRSSP
jgi:GMP synthase-like glutamine amidotransferase